MPSNAFTLHLAALLRDAEELDDIHQQMPAAGPARPQGLAALNRAAVVMTISAWESYVELLVTESVAALRPPPPPHGQGVWPALQAYTQGAVGRFNTPNAANVERLVRDCLGLANLRQAWAWQNTTPPQAGQQLDDALTYRHQVAHGVNPRPAIHNHYSSQMPTFVRRLARATDAACDGTWWRVAWRCPGRREAVRTSRRRPRHREAEAPGALVDGRLDQQAVNAGPQVDGSLVVAGVVAAGGVVRVGDLAVEPRRERRRGPNARYAA